MKLKSLTQLLANVTDEEMDFKNFILENKPIGATVIFENCI